jgi:hypothetical protein
VCVCVCVCTRLQAQEHSMLSRWVEQNVFELVNTPHYSVVGSDCVAKLVRGLNGHLCSVILLQLTQWQRCWNASRKAMCS